MFRRRTTLAWKKQFLFEQEATEKEEQRKSARLILKRAIGGSAAQGLTLREAAERPEICTLLSHISSDSLLSRPAVG
jgi:hypothetical protein